MPYVKPRPGPIEERDFDPVVVKESTYRDIEWLPDRAPTPEEVLALKQRLADPSTPAAEAEAIQEILASC